MPYVCVNGTRFYYRIRGAGPRVVLIHGLGGDHTGYDGPVREYLTAGHEVLAMDLRGHGKSTRAGSTYSTDLFAEDVAAMLRELKFQPASVIGISIGGAVAMKLAARQPRSVTKLVLIDTWARCDESARAFFHEWLAASRHSDEVLRDIVLVRTATPEFVRANREFVALFNQRWPSAPGASFRRSCVACAEHDATGGLADVRAPTLVLVGSRDILVPPRYAREVARQITGASLKVIRGGGHVPWLDRPEACIRALQSFL